MLGLKVKVYCVLYIISERLKCICLSLYLLAYEGSSGTTTLLPKTLRKWICGHFTYKVLNLYFFIRYETYISHTLHTTLFHENFSLYLESQGILLEI